MSESQIENAKIVLYLSADCLVLIPRKLNNSSMAAEYVENCKDIFCNLVAAKIAREVRGKGNA